MLKAYRERLKVLESKRSQELVTRDDEILLASALAVALKAIKPGNKNAGKYHDLMIGVVEFIFFPSLTKPKKEVEIHQGRKRIDITMVNSAISGVFERLHRVRKLPCGNIAIECKNYSGQVRNPELGQLAGRFAPNRGQAGILLCRKFEDRGYFVQKCRDTLKDDRGLIVPLSDAEVLKALNLIENEGREALDDYLEELLDEVFFT